MTLDPEQELEGWGEVWGPDDERAQQMPWVQFAAASGANAYLADVSRLARFRKASPVLEELTRRYALIVEQAVDQAPVTTQRLLLKLSPISPGMVFTKETVRADGAAGYGAVPGFAAPGPTELEPLVQGIFSPAYAVGPVNIVAVDGHRSVRARGTSSDPAYAPVRMGAVVVDASDGFTGTVYVDAFAPAEVEAAEQRLEALLRLIVRGFGS